MQSHARQQGRPRLDDRQRCLAHWAVVSGYLPGQTPMSSYLGIVAGPSSRTSTERIFFALNSRLLDARAKATLDSLISRTRAKATDPVTVSVGVLRAVDARASDRRLAADRAAEVAAYLRKNGMPGIVKVGTSIPTRLTTAGARRVDVSVSWSSCAVIDSTAVMSG